MPYVDPVLYNALLQSRQGGMTRLTGAHRVYPQSHCCISGNTVGVYKDPVVVLEISDQDVCTYEDVSVSFGGSYSASSTIQTYSVDWGDGNTTNGAWPPAASISHPNGGYNLPGNYVIIVTVTDLLGATNSQAVDVYVDDCWNPLDGYQVVIGMPPDDISTHQVYTTRLYDNDDYWTDDVTASPPTWNHIVHTSYKSKTTIMPSATTQRFFGYGWGIWEYSPLPFDTGAWASVVTEAQIATWFGHGADYNEAYIFRMVFSPNPTQEEHGYAGVYLQWTDGGGDEHVMYGLVYTTDAFSHIQYATEIDDFEEGTDATDYFSYTFEGGLGVDFHADTVYIGFSKYPEQDGLGSPTFDGFWRLYRSQSHGLTVDLAASQTYTWGTDGYGTSYSNNYFDIWVPYVSSDYAGGAVFWTTTCLQKTNLFWDFDYVPLVYRSRNFGITVENIGNDSGGVGLNILHGPWNSLSRVYGVSSTELGKGSDSRAVYTWRSGMGWTLFNQHPGGPGSADQTCAAVVVQQTGYALHTMLTLIQPCWITSGVVEDKNRPEDDCYWITWVP